MNALLSLHHSNTNRGFDYYAVFNHATGEWLDFWIEVIEGDTLEGAYENLYAGVSVTHL